MNKVQAQSLVWVYFPLTHQLSLKPKIQMLSGLARRICCSKQSQWRFLRFEFLFVSYPSQCKFWFAWYCILNLNDLDLYVDEAVPCNFTSSINPRLPNFTVTLTTARNLYCRGSAWRHSKTKHEQTSYGKIRFLSAGVDFEWSLMNKLSCLLSDST